MKRISSRAAGLCVVAAAAIALVATDPLSSPPVFKQAVSARVEVKFDDAQVVHVFASTRQDAAFALGMVHAQRRGSQLEVAKRMVHGRLSELVGRRGLEHDKLMRRLGLVAAAQRQFALLPGHEQKILEAYASGINAGRRSSQKSTAPHPIFDGVQGLDWEGLDCVAWSLFMAFQLSGNWQSELDRLHLSRTLEWSDVLLLLPGTLAAGNLPINDSGGTPMLQESAVGSAMPQLQDATGSNAWAVAGSRSTSGRPLLANDPHLPMTVPSPWFFARVSVVSDDPGERQDVIGATSPGLPMVLIGRTERVAWGITRNGADTQDLYLEEVDPSNDLRYRSGWDPLESTCRHASLSIL